jgi:multimeric flavodoxin WrbA
MNVIAINGSPRKKWNTATLLEKALVGAASCGANTELVHLYSLYYSGCISCFACKLIDGKSFGKCAVKDELTDVLEKCMTADALVLGSPIYLGTATGEMRSFIERLVYPPLSYEELWGSIFPRNMKTTFIYTCNVPEDRILDFCGQQIKLTETMLQKIFRAPSETLLCCETYQFEDYSKMACGIFDEKQRAQRRKEVFPIDCQKAFDLGVRLAAGNVP